MTTAPATLGVTVGSVLPIPEQGPRRPMVRVEGGEEAVPPLTSERPSRVQLTSVATVPSLDEASARATVAPSMRLPE